MTRSMLAHLDLVQKLILVVIPLGLLHHADHVGRADHSSWPFRPEVGPFTFTLLIYPVLVLVFLTRRGTGRGSRGSGSSLSSRCSLIP